MPIGVSKIAIQPYVVDVNDESLFSLDHLISPQPVKQRTKSDKKKKRSKNEKTSSTDDADAGSFDVDSFPLYSPPPSYKTSTSSSSGSPMEHDDLSHLFSPDPSVRTVSDSTFDSEDSTMTPSSKHRQSRRRSSTSSRSKTFKIASLDDSNNDELDASVHSKGLQRRSSTKKLRRRSSGLSTTSSLGSISMLTDGDESMLLSVGDFTSSPSQSRRRRSSRKRVISFNKRTKMRAIPTLKSLTDEEKSMIWYRESELKSIKQDALEVLRQARSGSDDDSEDQNEEEVCLRGLGSSLGRPGGPQNRRSNWMMALSCVLDEQHRQKSLGIYDEEHIAKLYRAFAVHSQHAALSTGRQDAKDVGANIPALHDSQLDV